jgi:hypothetical protein
MRSFRAVLCLAAVISFSANAGEAEDRAALARVLALVAPIVHVAATSPDPQAAQKEIDALLAGQNEQANRIAAEVFDGMLNDFPPESRPALRSIGRDLLILMQRERLRNLPEAR